MNNISPEAIWGLVAILNLFITTIIIAVIVALEKEPIKEELDPYVFAFILLYIGWPFFLTFQIVSFLTAKFVKYYNNTRVCPKCKSLY